MCERRRRVVNLGTSSAELLRLQFLYSFAAKLIQDGHRREGGAFDVKVDFAELVRRPSQAAELVAKKIQRDAAIARGIEKSRRFRVNLNLRMPRKRPLHGKWFGLAGSNVNIHDLPRDGRRRVREFSRRAIYVGVMCAPDNIAGADPLRLNRSPAKSEFDCSIGTR